MQVALIQYPRFSLITSELIGQMKFQMWPGAGDINPHYATLTWNPQREIAILVF